MLTYNSMVAIVTSLLTNGDVTMLDYKSLNTNQLIIPKTDISAILGIMFIALVYIGHLILQLPLSAVSGS